MLVYYYLNRYIFSEVYISYSFWIWSDWVQENKNLKEFPWIPTVRRIKFCRAARIYEVIDNSFVYKTASFYSFWFFVLFFAFASLFSKWHNILRLICFWVFYHFCWINWKREDPSIFSIVLSLLPFCCISKRRGYLGKFPS